jgi:hypothetical protein
MKSDSTRDVTQSENVVASLLKSPEQMIEIISQERSVSRVGVSLLTAAAVFHALFGLAAGFFGGWQVAIMDVVKAPLVALCSLLLCFPSLYIFASVGGASLSISQTFLLGASCLTMIGLLLVGLSPVIWLFSVSTESLSFVSVLAVLIWLIAILFTVSYIGKLQSHKLLAKAGGVKVWLIIFILVTLQMVTCLRPFLVAPNEQWLAKEKMFFLEHFSTTFK